MALKVDRSKKAGTSDQPDNQAEKVDLAGRYWKQSYRKPLYDPPPVFKPVVKRKPRPINYTVSGTILDAAGSQAILKLNNGQVRLLKLGEQVTNDPLDGTITDIAAEGIKVQRKDDIVTVPIKTQ